MNRSICFGLVLLASIALAPPASAQTSLWRPDAVVFGPSVAAFEQLPKPDGAPPTPRHTGIKALVKGVFVDLAHIPSKENLYWAAAGGGLALAVHPLDGNINRKLAYNHQADNFFKPGEILGESGTLIGTAAVVYAFGRLRDEPKISHVGMDLIQSLVVSEIVTQSLKYATHRERPDHTTKNSFPSGHAADTFAFATALERHLGWRYAVPAYAFSSYVALSRLPANRHWFSDAVFGAAVGVIAGRTVTSHEAHPFPVAVTPVPGGVAMMYTRPRR